MYFALAKDKEMANETRQHKQAKKNTNNNLPAITTKTTSSFVKTQRAQQRARKKKRFVNVNKKMEYLIIPDCLSILPTTQRNFGREMTRR